MRSVEYGIATIQAILGNKDILPLAGLLLLHNIEASDCRAGLGKQIF